MSPFATRISDMDPAFDRTVAADSGDERSFADLLAVLVRRWRLIAAILVAILVPAFIYVTVATRYYTASAVVLLEPRSSLSQADGMRYSFASDSALVDSQMKLLTSETVLRRAVDRENLQEDPEFGTPSAGFWQSIRRAIGLSRPEAEERKENASATVTALANATVVKRPERTYVMEVAVTSRDPRKAARLANAIAESYIADQMDARGAISKREQDYLEGNIAELRRKIEKAENDVESYKAQNQIIGSSGKLVNEQLLTDINTQLAAARTKASEARSRFEQVRLIVGSGRSVDALPEALKSAVIDRLRTQYAEIVRQEANAKTTLGELHPQYREVQQQLRDTRRLINEELTRIADGARNDLRIAEANERSMSKQVEDLKREATTTNQSSVRLRELEREVDTSKAVLDSLLKAKGTVTRDGVDMPIARIIAAAAAPLAPSSPKRIPVMLIAMAAGAGLGLAAAFAAEGVQAARAGARAPTEPPAQHLRMPQPTQDAFGECAAHPDGAYAAAISDLADRVPAREAERPTACLLIGCGAGAPGAALAANLAQALAAGGRATLLIELNPRAGLLSRPLSRSLPVGIVELGDGRASLGVLALEAAESRLVVVPGALGQRDLKAPRDLDDREMGDFGRASDFDVVLGYVADPRALGDIDDALDGADLVVVAADLAVAAPKMAEIAERILAQAGDRGVLVDGLAAAA